MKVRELIEALQRMPQDREVLIPHILPTFVEVDVVEENVYDLDNNWLWDFDTEGEPDETDNTLDAVVLNNSREGWF